MICTRCGSENCRRSRRRHVEFALSAIGVLPWRCIDCRARFYARRVALRYLPYARCRQCGNTQLKRVRTHRLDSGFTGRLAVWLGARPLRCEFCRNNFTSWRLLRRVEETPAQTHPEQNAAGARN